MAGFVLVAVVVLDAGLVVDICDAGYFAVVHGTGFLVGVVDAGAFAEVFDADIVVDASAESFALDIYPPLQAVAHQPSNFVVWLNDIIIIMHK